MARRSDDGVGLVEFLTDETGDVEGVERRESPDIAKRLVALCARWRSVAKAVVAVGAAGSVVSAFLPQQTVRLGGHAIYAVDGFGRVRVQVADRAVQFIGHAPPLGLVALVAGALLFIVVCVSLFRTSRVVEAAAGVLAGVAAGTFACISVEFTGSQEWSSWGSGWWLLGASALFAVAGTMVAIIGRPITERHDPIADP